MREARLDEHHLARPQLHRRLIGHPNPALAAFDQMKHGRPTGFEVHPPGAAGERAHLHAATQFEYPQRIRDKIGPIPGPPVCTDRLRHARASVPDSDTLDRQAQSVDARACLDPLDMLDSQQ
jgi:hypothetical protein